MFCTACGTASKEGDKFCAKCGAAINATGAIKRELTADEINLIKTLRKQSGLQMKFYTFEEVKPDKLRNAISSYATSLEEGETVIFQADNTVLGKADRGFILTTRRFYSDSFIVDVKDIREINYQWDEYSDEGTLKSLTLQPGTDTAALNVVTDKKVFSYKVYLSENIINLLNQTVKILVS